MKSHHQGSEKTTHRLGKIYLQIISPKGLLLRTYKELLKCNNKKNGGSDSYGVWDRHVHTEVFKMDSQHSPTVIIKILKSFKNGPKT